MFTSVALIAASTVALSGASTVALSGASTVALSGAKGLSAPPINFGFVAPPPIECTVVRVKSQIEFAGLKRFPEKYLSLNNTGANRTFGMGGQFYPGVLVASLAKYENYEKLRLQHGETSIAIELFGKPISRQGVLTWGKQILGEVTCH